jgi:transcriptional regulator with XRE-family HTH domain
MLAEAPHSRQAIAERLKNLRLALGYSQEFMAQAIGFASHRAWAHYEKGRRQPCLKDLNRIETVTGVPVEWILRGIDRRMPRDLHRRIVSAAQS